MKLQKYYKWIILLLFIIIPIVLYTSKESLFISKPRIDFRTVDYLKQKPNGNHMNIKPGYTTSSEYNCFLDCTRKGNCVGFTTKVENDKLICTLKQALDFEKLTTVNAENYNTYKSTWKSN